MQTARSGADAAERLFEDETIAGDEAAVDEAIGRAGGARHAIRALLVEIAELERARAADASLGFRRGRQPGRRLT